MLPLAAGAPSWSSIQITERKEAEFYSLDTLEGSGVKPLLTCRRVAGRAVELMYVTDETKTLILQDRRQLLTPD